MAKRRKPEVRPQPPQLDPPPEVEVLLLEGDNVPQWARPSGLALLAQILGSVGHPFGKPPGT